VPVSRAGIGNKLLFTQGLSNNAGLMSLAGGTFDNNSKPLNNTGQISGFGIFRSGGLTNNGAITFAGGTTPSTATSRTAPAKNRSPLRPRRLHRQFHQQRHLQKHGRYRHLHRQLHRKRPIISDPAENFFKTPSSAPPAHGPAAWATASSSAAT